VWYDAHPAKGTVRSTRSMLVVSMESRLKLSKLKSFNSHKLQYTLLTNVTNVNKTQRNWYSMKSFSDLAPLASGTALSNMFPTYIQIFICVFTALSIPNLQKIATQTLYLAAADGLYEKRFAFISQVYI